MMRDLFAMKEAAQAAGVCLVVGELVAAEASESQEWFAVAVLWEVVGKLEVEDFEATNCSLHHSTARHRDESEEAADLVDTRVDQAEVVHRTAADREWVPDNQV